MRWITVSGGYDIIEDITACKQVKEKLRESEERFRLVMQSAQDGIILIDDAGKIIFWNKCAESIFSYTQDEVIGKPLTIIMPERYRGVHGKVLCKSTSVGKTVELQGLRKDGTEVPIEVSLASWETGGKMFYSGIIRDITERKQTEKILQKERDRAQNYLDVVGVIIVAIDSDQKVTLINKKGCEILGYKEEEIIGKDWFDIFIPHRNRQEANAVYQKLMSGEVEPAEYFENPVLTKDGEERLIAWHNTVLRDEESNIIGTLSSGQDITERKIIEDELKASEEKYSTLVENGNDGIIIVQDDELKFANEKYAKMLGYTKEEVVGRSFFKDISGEYKDLVIGRYKKRLKKDPTVPRRYEVDFLSKDGKRVQVEINASFIDYEGRPADMVILRDITARRKAEEALMASEEKYSTLVEKGNDGIVIIQDYILKFVNEKFAKSLGYTREETIGKPLADFISEEHRDLVVERYERRIKKDRTIPRKYEVNFLSKEGEKVPIEVNASYIKYEGRPADMAIFRNITERKKVERALRIKDTAIESSINAIAFANLEGNLTYVNPSFLKLWGYDSDKEVVGKPAVGFWREAEKAAKVLKALFVEGNCTGELVAKKKDDTEFNVHLSASIIIDEDGSPIGIIASFVDITERKRTEDELQKYTEELKHSNELKDLFTDVLRHDLLNPAGVARGFTELLLEMEEDDRKIQLLKTIDRNNRKLIEMIETAAKFAKLESVEDIDFVVKDIGSIFRDVLDNFKPQLEEKQITTEFSAKGTYPSKINPVIEEAFVNLLSNAIKYSPEDGRIIIDILDAGDYWKVTVTDFGEGVFDKDKPLVFERFKRMDKRGIKGTGLGLAIVKRVIDLHGGNVGVDDNPQGRGSVFWVTVGKA